MTRSVAARARPPHSKANTAPPPEEAMTAPDAPKRKAAQERSKPKNGATKAKVSRAKSGSTKRVAAPPFVRIGFLVHDVSRMRRTLFDQEVRPLGITRAQWWALANLSRHEPEGMTQSDLARLLDVGKVTIGGLIDRLEASGHVNRRSDKGDRRIKRIFITDLGYSVIEAMAETGRRLDARVMRDIPVEHIRIAEDVMHLMKGNLRSVLQQDGVTGARDSED